MADTCFVKVNVCFVEVDMYVGEPVHTIEDEPEAGCKFGRDGRKNVVLVVGSRVVEGCMDCVGSLDDGVWVGNEGKDL